MIKASSIQNEYYFGDLPGSLQYKKTPQEIIDCELQNNDEDCGFTFCEHSAENLRRITPYTKRNEDWKIILMMQAEREGDEIWLKAALQDRKTGNVALLTSTNCKNNLERRGARAVKTVDGTWFVGHYRMAAPVIFWRELKNRLMY